ncbi:lipocalin-like 1 protein isoform X2 [Elgaria multicarinata webbii]
MWHIMAGVSNCPIFQSMRDVMKTSAAKVEAHPNGDMTVLTGYPFPDECQKVEMFFKKTDQPGHFTNVDTQPGPKVKTVKRDMRVISTDYHHYAFLYTFKEVEGEPSSATFQLYTRAPELTDELIESFKAHYHKVGLTDDLMVKLPKSDVCFKLLSA